MSTIIKAPSAVCLISLLLASPVLADLQGYYKAEGTGTDASANGRTATVVGSAGYRASGPGLGQAFGFSNAIATGSSDGYVQVSGLSGANATALLGTGLTVSCYFNQDVFSNGGSMVNLRNAQNNTGFTLEPAFGNPGSVLAYVHTSAGFVQSIVPGFDAGEGHYMTMVFAPANQSLAVYRDGILVSNTPIGTETMNLVGTENFLIGSNAVNGYGYNGLIDEVQVFNNALTASEVAGLVPEPTSAGALAAAGLMALRRKRR